ncbi:hypothetical protein COO60DRAFT_1627685 [Scenedesmus sp. NREL 46B-D3]|nr:hypothetical protein COO60DRAFT_1627685 [Scenedesmus sp. NREL 46B-D3]
MRHIVDQAQALASRALSHGQVHASLRRSWLEGCKCVFGVHADMPAGLRNLVAFYHVHSDAQLQEVDVRARQFTDKHTMAMPQPTHPLQLLIQQLPQLFPDREAAWWGRTASVLVSSNAGIIEAIAAIIDFPDDSKRAFVEARLEAAQAAPGQLAAQHPVLEGWRQPRNEAEVVTMIISLTIVHASLAVALFWPIIFSAAGFGTGFTKQWAEQQPPFVWWGTLTTAGVNTLEIFLAVRLARREKSPGCSLLLL